MTCKVQVSKEYIYTQFGFSFVGAPVEKVKYEYSSTKHPIKRYSKNSALETLHSISYRLPIGVFSSIHLKQIKADATTIHAGYMKKIGFCHKILDKIKSLFTETTTMKVNRIYNEIMGYKEDLPFDTGNQTHIPPVQQEKKGKLAERGERIEDLQNKTAELEAAANVFSKNAAQLAEKSRARHEARKNADTNCQIM